ncbi:MAG: glycosyltransferase family 4 protein [Planctomycetaceae bacterium]
MSNGPGLQSAVGIAAERPAPRRPSSRPRVLFLNRSYWPDGEATGQLLTELTEDLADRFDVSVVAGLPNTNPSNESFPLFRTVTRNGVAIHRVPHTRLPKRWLPARAVNFITFLLLATARATCCRRQDVLVVETDPFLLAFAGAVLRLRHRGRLVVYLQDIHPDVGVAVGRLKETRLTRFLRTALLAVYRRADRVVVLSRDMRDTLVTADVPARSIACLPNWTDIDQIRPAAGVSRFRTRAGITPETFLVMYSGNLGVTQQLERVLDAAEQLLNRRDVLFAFVGGGAAESELRSAVERRGLSNLRFFPYQPKEDLGDSLSAADLHVITVHPAALAFLMPSKFYGILAAGRPVVAAAHAASELATEILENRVGYVVPPGDAAALSQTIANAADRREELAAFGERARRLAESTYDRRLVTSRFGDLLDEVFDGSQGQKEPAAA